MSKNSIPAVRFCDFSDNWESKKIGDLGSVSMNKRIFKDETSETGEVPFYKIGTFGSEPDSFITREKFEEYKSKYPYPEIGDILISASGSIGRTVEYQGEEAYFQDSNIVWLKHDERLDNSFLKQFYSIVKWEGIEGTTIKRLYNKNILETPISLPSPAEQSAIGTLFRTLDDLLSSYKDNLTNYQSLKATMLSKMFPKAGQTVPEIRLDGFEGEWELCEINDLADDFQSGGTPKTNVQEYWDGDIPWIQSSDLGINCLFEIKVQKSISEKGLESSSAKIIPKDSIAVVTRVGVGKLAVMRHEYATSQDFLSLSNLKSNIEFTAYLLYRLLQKEVNQLQGTSIKGITKVELLSKKVLIPSLPEQQAIGAYFSTLDNLINSHHEKISQLETLKKKLLQDMFI
ncbi:restriction endonuclease subunit S [Streptococcus mitis]|uniref:EcoKI restriction-modification system protein HsdS n=1 Tax=Streptococcus mitis TaxID=28037 RepID=A0A428D0L6_STRMT|nr:restriction endonuclease subunit S [Streptococcus mitis]RSI85662.1 EcoKI restriction-modification system protein HsdS [Streptococcus mitis]RSI90281.1 EcoKI restriction-modification system protein HsdS [Streptococcus mitis]